MTDYLLRDLDEDLLTRLRAQAGAHGRGCQRLVRLVVPDGASAALEMAMALEHPVNDCLYVALALAEEADLRDSRPTRGPARSRRP
jgi:plasmid stability protein